MNYIRKNVSNSKLEKLRSRIEEKLLKPLKEFFQIDIITKISKTLYDFCGRHQMAIFIIVAIVFLFFVGFVFYKNFSGETNVVIRLCNTELKIGYIESDFFSKLVLTLVEVATLPVLILTLTFSAHGGFQNKKRENAVDLKFGNLNNEIKHNNEDIKKVNESIGNIKKEIATVLSNHGIVNSENLPEYDTNSETEAINDDKIGEVNTNK